MLSLTAPRVQHRVKEEWPRITIPCHRAAGSSWPAADGETFFETGRPRGRLTDIGDPSYGLLPILDTNLRSFWFAVGHGNGARSRTTTHKTRQFDGTTYTFATGSDRAHRTELWSASAPPASIP